MERMTRETLIRNTRRAGGVALGVVTAFTLPQEGLAMKAAAPECPLVASQNWLCYHPNAVRGEVTLVYNQGSFLDWYAKIHADLLGGPRPDIRGWWEERAKRWIRENPGSESSAGVCSGEAAKVAGAIQGDEAIWWGLNDTMRDTSGRVVDIATLQHIEYARLLLTLKHAYDTPEFFHDDDRLNLPQVLNAQRNNPGKIAIINTPDSGISSFFTAIVSINGSSINGWRAGQWLERNVAGANLSAWFPHHYSSREDIPDNLRTKWVRAFESLRPPADIWNEMVVDFCAKGADVLH
ncbi:hypothetical protein A2631_00620 [Candidatus Daviesbacteria bacterium RIFCSPHIGHO2_01_FULL_44_29]|uniref:Uncharacterized protein n=1 Tax=Candidatus Daviesbacteria bacterium RIFCSPHIGHO2_02_FULL_43_12 TaxID=1797776 RepID=A0A1F5KHE1_9BACT|nr:MAG: hypothetical protein A2631_00620 [Candidatus Daviesbacteria bacterium RIFCSPHIGHO2_01_FULL_44_29]OGE40332.1 MAG: hypothetical protein A3D25_03040 [Candidatus Daviesbacteria bacterium RIFCSPHIGHO2_02_FULL_43_12]OGE69750.1 MAG: hypothetical protein A3B55_02165 [Candidatus Daviesbacteria bacterium RIFCSPLOWO2_01_FULL_43_15]